MKAIVPIATPVLVELADGQPSTTSLDVAAHFGKLHKDVLKRINSLDCSPEFAQRNFAPCSRPGANNKPEPFFRLTRDGFTFLCMGFTGKEAAKWKEAYINAFNEMEAALQQVSQTKAKRAPKALPGLSSDQQSTLKALVVARVEALPKEKQGKAAITCWSALKSKFGCGYKEIAPEQFTEAVSLVARVVLEGEWLGKPASSGSFADIVGQPLKRSERWMVSLDAQGRERYQLIPYDACVMTQQELMQAMVTPGELPVSTEEMFEFAMAAMANLKARSDYQSMRVKQQTERRVLR